MCYTADALLSYEMIEAKLPYSLSHQAAIDSREKLRGLGCDYYIMAHRGVCGSGEIDTLIEENQKLVRAPGPGDIRAGGPAHDGQ